MTQVATVDGMAAEEDRRLSEAIKGERSRLQSFIRARVLDQEEAEDILQDVFFELVEAYRLMKPIEQVGAWLFRVARNRIIDFGRKKKPERLAESFNIQEILLSEDAGPDASYTRAILCREIENALSELPETQRTVFIAHEMEGRSFKEIAAESGVAINTLLSRKHSAVLHLRKRLREIYEEWISE